ncbi:GNAT family N-acetyltransferase [Kribbella deserti]|uniref:GNAT family N-acetyltransferase n=1 Tax=Kribbella deserti TaxID=1926257 RepID=A0ABV6QRW6_9ACTN
MTSLLDELLAAYDEQLRDGEPTGDVVQTTDGPLVRVEYPRRGFIGCRTLGGLEGADLDALIARQVEFFRERGLPVEWKTRGHDLPADLPDRLIAAGFVPEEQETVMIGESQAVADRLADVVLPDAVTIRRVTERDDLDRIAAMESEVWADDWGWLAEDLDSRINADPEAMDVYVAEADGRVVSAAWAVHREGTDFTGLWGGSTLAAWRRKGIYRALVAVRARRAVERGHRYLQVDASPDSAPILQALGFHAVTTTTPYVYTP